MAKKVDDNGWWTIKDNPLSKVGIYPYLGKQIDDSLEPNKVYRVFRPAEELLNSETVKSFNLVPLVNDHEMIGKDYKPAEKKGVDGIIYNPRVAHKNTLIGNIKIYSEKMMNDIKHGKKELSMGYTCTYDLTPGDWDGQHYDVVQRNLRGNHVALVDRGRMGSEVRVYDKHICCDAMPIISKKIKKTKAEDVNEETWELRKSIGLNYVTPRKESTINRLIKESMLPISRKTEATKLYGNNSYRRRFDAKFKDDKDWIDAQKVRFKRTRKKVGINKMLNMPSYQRFVDKQQELADIMNIRNNIEKKVYGRKAITDTAWIKLPKQEQEEPNILDKMVAKSAETAAIISLLSTVLNMNKANKKKPVKDGVIIKKKRALDAALTKKLYKLGVAYVKALAKSCNAKAGMDSADILKTISKKKMASLDKALDVKLYKLGHSYGRQLRNIIGKKHAKDALSDDLILSALKNGDNFSIKGAYHAGKLVGGMSEPIYNLAKTAIATGVGAYLLNKLTKKKSAKDAQVLSPSIEMTSNYYRPKKDSEFLRLIATKNPFAYYLIKSQNPDETIYEDSLGVRLGRLFSGSLTRKKNPTTGGLSRR